MSRFFLCCIYSGELRAALQGLIDRRGSFSVKYTPLNFQCQYPTRLRDEDLERSASEGSR